MRPAHPSILARLAGPTRSSVGVDRLNAAAHGTFKCCRVGAVNEVPGGPQASIDSTGRPTQSGAAAESSALLAQQLNRQERCAKQVAQRSLRLGDGGSQRRLSARVNPTLRAADDESQQALWSSELTLIEDELGRTVCIREAAPASAPAVLCRHCASTPSRWVHSAAPGRSGPMLAQSARQGEPLRWKLQRSPPGRRHGRQPATFLARREAPSRGWTGGSARLVCATRSVPDRETTR